MFGEVGQLGHLVRDFAGAEPVLDLAPRLRLNAMVEIVLGQEEKAKIATHNHVQVSKIQHLLTF